MASPQIGLADDEILQRSIVVEIETDEYSLLGHKFLAFLF